MTAERPRVISVERAARASANNYTKVGLKRPGPTSFEFTLNEKHTLPEYDMGVLENLGARRPQVTLLERLTLKLEWTA